MKSNKQKRSEISARKKARREKEEMLAALAAEEARLQLRRKARPRGEAPVNEARLRPNNSYSIPAFVERGFYVPIEFACKKCGKLETWTAEQQKWWYEIAKGDVFTTATMCRPCRRKERARRDDARRIHLEGLARKQRTAKG